MKSHEATVIDLESGDVRLALLRAARADLNAGAIAQVDVEIEVVRGNQTLAGAPMRARLILHRDPADESQSGSFKKPEDLE